MMYSYPFFSFPHIRRFDSRYYSPSYPYSKQIIHNNDTVIKSKGYYDVNKNSTSKKMDFSSESNRVSNRNPNSFANVEITSSKKEKDSPKRTFSGFGFLNNFFHQEDRAPDEEFFDLFGLKLYHDDLLLLGLIFFLYKEDVKDEYLFLALVLLLIS